MHTACECRYMYVNIVYGGVPIFGVTFNIKQPQHLVAVWTERYPQSKQALGTTLKILKLKRTIFQDGYTCIHMAM